MRELSKSCTQFSTSEKDERLAKLLLSKENRAMGSGGYDIERHKGPNGSIRITLHHAWGSGNSKHQIFIKSGEMWATSMAGWLMDVLIDEHLSFTTKQVASPSFILRHMQKIVAEDKAHAERRYA